MQHSEAGLSQAASQKAPMLKTTLLVVDRLLREYSSPMTKCVVVARVVSLKPFVLNDCTSPITVEARG